MNCFKVSKSSKRLLTDTNTLIYNISKLRTLYAFKVDLRYKNQWYFLDIVPRWHPIKDIWLCLQLA